MATVNERTVRTEVRDSNKRLDQLELDFKDFKTSVEEEFRDVTSKLDRMQRSSNAYNDTLTKLSNDLPRLIAEGLKQQLEKQNSGIPSGAETSSQETISRYGDLNPTRNTDDARFDRVECPVFDGTTPFRSWLYKCEQFLEINRIPANRKIRSVYYRLDGIALEWHQCFLEDKSDRVVSWEEYVKNMSLRFDSCRSKDPMMQLKELQQRSSVENYQRDFESIRFQAKCSEAHALSMFLGGLKDKLQGFVSLHRPATVMEAFDLASLYEEALDADYSPISENVKPYQAASRFNVLCIDIGPEELCAKEASEMSILEDNEELVELDVAQSDKLESMEEENVIDSQVMKMNVGFEEVNELKAKELFDLDGALDTLNHDLNSKAGVICFDGVKAHECYYQILEAMVEQVWSGRVLVLIYLDRWNLNLIFLNLHSKKDIIASVPWDFKKRKKSLRQQVSLLEIRKEKKKSTCTCCYTKFITLQFKFIRENQAAILISSGE